MPVLKKNISGFDVLEYLSLIDEEGPLTLDQIYSKYYPGDESLEENSKELKLIRDGMEFLEDIDLLIEGPNGYEYQGEEFRAEDYRLQLLEALHTHSTEKGYALVLDTISSKNELVFERDSELRDWMNAEAPNETWSGNALQYIVRSLEAIGVMSRLEETGDSDKDVGLFLDNELMTAILSDCITTNSTELAGVLETIDSYYLPVYAADGRVSQYIQLSLRSLEDTGRIELTRKDDGGMVREIRGDEFNRISITQ